MTRIRLFFFLCFFSWANAVLAQGEHHLPIQAKKIDVPIQPDGILDEAVWATIPKASDFWQQFPVDSVKAEGNTELQMAYDEQNLYVAVTCYSKGDDWIVTSLRRDFSFRYNDNITLVLDTYGDQTNAFVFGINAYGVRREALIANGGRQISDFQSSWDNKWKGDAKIDGNVWVAELAIPFAAIRFQKGSNNWRVNCYRSETQHNEWSSLNRIPRNRLVMDLSYSTPINFEDPPKGGGSNISLIPFVAAATSRDFEDPTQTKAKSNFEFGGDAKIGITSGLNLDLTFNPDFSQVEVDRQVTNLDRFEIFFPERRQFFLENADLFGSFGLSRVNPFFSRRIGIAFDTLSGQNIQNPIIYGARLSGKINENLRVGLLNMQTAKEVENGLPGFNYTVAAVQQKVFSRSNVSFIFVNKQAVNGQDFNGEFNDYNRVAGFEYRLASANNEWGGKAFYHHAFSPEKKAYPFTTGVQIEKQVRDYRFEWAHVLIGNGFDAEVGFVPRRDYLLLSPEGGLFFYPKKGKINQHSINFDSRIFLQIGEDGNEIIKPWGLSERQFELQYSIDFKNNTGIELTINDTELTLLNDFDPTRLQDDDIFLPSGSKYQYLFGEATYSTDQRKLFYMEFGPTIGQFFNGSRLGLSTSATYRFQPYGTVSLNVNYNRVKLAEPFVPVDVWLIGPRFDLTFSKNLFLTAFFQYNNQQDNLNINTRFQWRFAPVSDLFIVYTDNYLTDSFSQFQSRNRALVAKVTYWLNL